MQVTLCSGEDWWESENVLIVKQFHETLIDKWHWIFISIKHDWDLAVKSHWNHCTVWFYYENMQRGMWAGVCVCVTNPLCGTLPSDKFHCWAGNWSQHWCQWCQVGAGMLVTGQGSLLTLVSTTEPTHSLQTLAAHAKMRCNKKISWCGWQYSFYNTSDFIN